MKKVMYILITAGRGPIECGIAVQGVQRKFRQYLDSIKLSYEIVNQETGQCDRSLETIVFKVVSTDRDLLKPWLGTIQWICKSPIRKFSKRKNWYIKCQEIVLPAIKPVNTNDLLIKAFKSSGPGGQHRNKVETAIRITHKPTGTMVTASDSKSKGQNQKNALKKLKAKLELQNKTIQAQHQLEQWSSKLEIERGNPIKVFNGEKFKEF